MRRPDCGDIPVDDLGVAEQALGHGRHLRLPVAPVGLVPLSQGPSPGGAV